MEEEDLAGAPPSGVLPHHAAKRGHADAAGQEHCGAVEVVVQREVAVRALGLDAAPQRHGLQRPLEGRIPEARHDREVLVVRRAADRKTPRVPHLVRLRREEQREVDVLARLEEHLRRPLEAELHRPFRDEGASFERQGLHGQGGVLNHGRPSFSWGAIGAKHELLS